MKNFSIEESVKAGWTLWKEHKKLLTLATLILFILNIPGNEKLSHPMEGAANIVLSLVTTFISIGWLRILFKTFDGHSSSLHDLFGESRLFWRYVVASLLFTLGIIAGFILFVIPGIYFMLRYQFVFFNLVDRNLSIRESFELSAKLTEGVKWKLLGFFLVSLALNALGAVALLVGLLVSMPVTMLASIYIYRRLRGNESEVVAEPILI